MSDLQLKSCEEFLYTNQGQNPLIDNVDDEEEFDKTYEALKMLGFNDDDCRSVFKILAAILHLGNVKVGIKQELLCSKKRRMRTFYIL